MRYLSAALDRFWFMPGSAARLGAIRLILGTTAFVFVALRLRQYSDIATTSADLFEPVGPIKLLDAPISPVAFEALLVVTLLVSVLFAIGWQFRWSGPLFAALLVVVVSYRNSWSMIYHVDNMLLLHIVVLGLTRSADAVSLDALTGRPFSEWWRRAVHLAMYEPVKSSERRNWHWEYGYPIRLLFAVTVAVYALSAIAKLAGPLGMTWALGDGLRNQVGFDALRKELLEGSAGALAYTVFNNVPLATAVGIGAIVLELGSIAALFHPRLGQVWSVGAYGMHWGIHAVMDISFWYQLSGLAFTPFLVTEGVVSWCRAEALRWIRALASLPHDEHGGDLSDSERPRGAPVAR
jgi:hypothetical protein